MSIVERKRGHSRPPSPALPATAALAGANASRSNAPPRKLSTSRTTPVVGALQKQKSIRFFRGRSQSTTSDAKREASASSAS
eukprot:1626888-Prymnesium_polylepis.1